ncbi:sensor histidine kinase [Xylanibacter ruminicola]|uniref:histidine kinase n=1 Tax=Xylanibacter ruminicola TaxID=839 RepID=A0A1M6THB7_XYLRU|nr:HAMP domain-containing sensor histidine kinase [Xylanibacter ruminicola]SHK56313.1 Histidine kinase-, DNA gyrase B-, and HSP90-like ATPase [Xylanibacter ruminicola]
MIWLYIIIGVSVVAFVWWFAHHQRRLRLRAHLMQEAIRNQDFTFRLPTDGLLPGERAMQETLNQLGDTIRQQVSKNEVESWERLTRVLTHEMMNATAPITSISQSMLNRTDVKGTPLEDGIQAIHDTSRHLSEFVANYRKMSELEKPVMTDVQLRQMLDDISRAYPQLSWEISVSADTIVNADAGMLRQVLMNLIKNAIEAEAQKIVIAIINEEAISNNQSLTLYVGNDGVPIPAENRQSLFVPFFTTKRSGSGIGLSLSRRMMIQQGGMLDLAEKPFEGCRAGFILTLRKQQIMHI